jgi:hypothetical protein
MRLNLHKFLLFETECQFPYVETKCHFIQPLELKWLLDTFSYYSSFNVYGQVRKHL